MKSESEFSRGIHPAHEQMRKFGFSETATTVAEVAARLGARRIQAIHGAPPNVLQTVYKAEAGNTPRTVADMASSTAMRWLTDRYMPTAGVDDEELERVLGQGNVDIFRDPLDGTSSFAEGQRYSTTGLAVYRDGTPLSAAICQPFERELLVAEAGKGGYLFPLTDRLALNNPEEVARRLEIVDRELKGASVYLDALFNGKTSPHKLELMRRIIELGGENVGFRMTGSNIDQQRQIATGRGVITITDAVGGFYDLAAGSLIIEQAGGLFIDGQTGGVITPETQVALGGVPRIVEQVAPLVQDIYSGYQGFK